MAMNREERISRTQRQEDIAVGIGAPAITEMQDSVPMFRKVGANVNLYIKIGNQLYQSTLTPAG
jgi:hypothetical protein|tara:strand:+ start:261 stop:452 length:192 start_codon:yes stop_codon:yes gene_type:complete